MTCSWCDEAIQNLEKRTVCVSTIYHAECYEAAQRSKNAPLKYWSTDIDRMRGEDLFERQQRREKKEKKNETALY